MGYHRAGFDVIGYDIAPQPNFPFEFIQSDALAIEAIEGVAAIHASPPCQSYLNLGAVNRSMGRKYAHEDLIGRTRELLESTGLPYVIENVADAKPQLRDPVRICGTGLNLPIRRHRLFESNLPLTGIPCAHDRLSTVVQVYGNAGGREHWPAAMGISWMTAAEMCEAIPPSYTEAIGKQLRKRIAYMNGPTDNALQGGRL
jgi:DNA (cytosine-5)-methyltransferase 1